MSSALGSWRLDGSCVSERLEARVVLAAGELDPTFGALGEAILRPVTAGYAAVLAMPDGKVVRAGSGNGDFLLERYNADGTPDGTFGSEGRVVTDFLGGSDAVSDLRLDGDGRIVALGRAQYAAVGAARYNADGSLDGTFGTGGKVAPPVDRWPDGTPRSDAYGWRFTPAGKYLAVTSLPLPFGGVMLVQRNGDGSLDTSFGDAGAVYRWQFGEYPVDVAFAPDGGILVTASGEGMRSQAVFRLTAAGGADGSRSQALDLATLEGYSGYPTQVVVLADGKIRAYTGYDLRTLYGYPWGYQGKHSSAVVQYNADLTLDTSFGAGGIEYGSGGFPPNAVVLPGGRVVDGGYDYGVFPDGRYVVMGVNGYVTVYGADGTVADGFRLRPAVSALPTVSKVRAMASAQQADGRTVVAGSVWVGPSPVMGGDPLSDFYAFRLTVDGRVDVGFGGGTEKAVVDFAGGVDRATVVVVDGGGRILMGGVSGTDFALARLTADGAIDGTFGTGGRVTTDFGSSDVLVSLALYGDGRILAAGNTGQPSVPAGDPPAFARYNADGSLDASFGVGGRVVLSQINGMINSAVLLADGGVAAVGTAYPAGSQRPDLLLVRLRSDGSPDPAFGGGDGIVTLGYTDASGRVVYDSGSDLLVRADGKIFVAGSSNSAGYFWRFGADGALDGTFGDGGRRAAPSVQAAGEQYARSLVPLRLAGADGKVLMTYAGGVARVTADGEVDGSFGTNGLALPPASPYNTVAFPTSVSVQGDGRVVLTGYASSSMDGDVPRVVRLQGDGSAGAAFEVSAVADLEGPVPPAAQANTARSPVLHVQRGGSGEVVAYAKFDLRGVATVSSAVLRFFAGTGGAADGPVEVGVYAVQAGAWDETTGAEQAVAPGLAEQLATVTVGGTQTGWYEADLTAYVRQQRAAGKHLVTVALRAETAGAVVVAARESETGGARLRLVAPPPAVPGGLTATAVDSATVRVDWTESSGDAAGTVVERWDGSAWAQVGVVPAGVHTFTDGGIYTWAGSTDPKVVWAGRAYAYRVKAFSANGTSAYAAAAAVTVPKRSELQWVGVAEGDPDPYGMRVWGAPGRNAYGYVRVDLSGYDVADRVVVRMYGEKDAADGAVSVSLHGTSGLARNENWWGYPAYTFNGKRVAWDNRPPFDSAAVATAAVSGTGSQWVEWDVTAYARQQQAAGHGVFWLAVAADGASVGPVVFRTSGHAAYPSTPVQYPAHASFEAGKLPVPAAPVVTGTSTATDELEVSWTPVAGAGGYLLEALFPGQYRSWSTRELPADQTRFVYTNVPYPTNSPVQPGATYQFRVRAKNASGTSAYSNTAAVTVQDAAAPTAPGNLTATVDVSGDRPVVKLSWTDASDTELWFDVQRSTDGVNFQSIWTTLKDATAYVDNYTRTSGKLYYRVLSAYYTRTSASSTVAVDVVPVIADAGLTFRASGTNIQLLNGPSWDLKTVAFLPQATTPAIYAFSSRWGSQYTIDLKYGSPIPSGGLYLTGSSDGVKDNVVLINGAGPGDVYRLAEDGRTTYYLVRGRLLKTVNVKPITVNGAPVPFLDVAGAAVVVDYTGRSPLAAVTASVAAGYAGGAWNGAGGIGSSAAAGRTGGAVGVVDSAVFGTTAIAGQAVDGSALVLRATSFGDADLDGAVTFRDVATATRLAAAGAGSPAATWASGDYNYDGRRDADDAALLALTAAVYPVTSTDIGPAAPGTSTVELSRLRDYDLVASGWDMFDQADGLRFAYQPIAGDFDISVRIDSVTAADAFASAGLMARDGVGAGARNFFVGATAAGGYRTTWRGTKNGWTDFRFADGIGPAFPWAYARLVRQGNTLIGYVSNVRTSWVEVSRLTFGTPLPETLNVGLAASAHDASGTVTARFREIGG